jgi:hypothetical protein
MLVLVVYGAEAWLEHAIERPHLVDSIQEGDEKRTLPSAATKV